MSGLSLELRPKPNLKPTKIETKLFRVSPTGSYSNYHLEYCFKSLNNAHVCYCQLLFWICLSLPIYVSHCQRQLCLSLPQIRLCPPLPTFCPSLPSICLSLTTLFFHVPHYQLRRYWIALYVPDRHFHVSYCHLKKVGL